MATQTVEFPFITGQTVTVKLFAEGSDTQQESVTAAEATNRKCTYLAAFTDAPAGRYTVTYFVGGVGYGMDYVTLAAATGTYRVSGNSNVVQISGNTQTASDLADFADTGYDPSTHKVATVSVVEAATLATLQANYAPAKAGDQMDLINSPNEAALAEIATGVWAAGTRTLTSFGTLVADIWSYATRLLTAGTNIVLAKGTGVTGFTDVTTSQVAAAILETPANLLATNGDGSVNATVVVDEESIAETVAAEVIAALEASGVTVDDASKAAIAATTATLLAASHSLVVNQPIVSRSSINLTIGDDYYTADGRAVILTIPGTPPDLTGATCKIYLAVDDSEGLSGTVFTEDDVGYCRFQFPSTYTAAITKPEQAFNVIVTLSNTHKLTPIRGTLHAVSRVTS